jgi:hypothetical protein
VLTMSESSNGMRTGIKYHGRNARKNGFESLLLKSAHYDDMRLSSESRAGKGLPTRKWFLPASSGPVDVQFGSRLDTILFSDCGELVSRALGEY